MTSGFHPRRLAELHRIAGARELDGLLIHSRSPDSRFLTWLLGYDSPSAATYLLLRRTDRRFFELSYHAAALRAADGGEVVEVSEELHFREALSSGTAGLQRLGVAGDAPFHHLLDITAEIVDLNTEFNDLLVSKEETEIDLLRAEARTLATLVESVGSAITPDTTEAAVATRIRCGFAELGGTEAFSTSVVSGETLRLTTLGPPGLGTVGAALCLDCGMKRNGSFTDITRMFFAGANVPSADGYRRLVDAHRSVIESLRPSTTPREIEERYRIELARTGIDPDSLIASELGHGIGFTLHEPPLLVDSLYAEDRIAPGTVFTLEPDVAFGGFRVRIEDMVVMTPSGAEILTAAN